MEPFSANYKSKAEICIIRRKPRAERDLAVGGRASRKNKTDYWLVCPSGVKVMVLVLASGEKAGSGLPL